MHRRVLFCFFSLLVDYELLKCERDQLLPSLKTFFVPRSEKSSELKAYFNTICHSSQLSGPCIAATEMQPSSVF